MFIKKIDINNFRCFEHYALDTSKRIVLITGANGSGKTSLLEAMHYACYLRSFRTPYTQDLCRFESNGYAIKIFFYHPENNSHHQLITSFDGKKKGVKVDTQAIVSHKKLFDYYRVVTITDHDLRIIDDGPGERRNFIDQHISLMNHQYSQHMRTLRKALEQRNALLLMSTVDEDTFAIWTRAAWEATGHIATIRMQYLHELSLYMQQLIAESGWFTHEISLIYKPRVALHEHWEDFEQNNEKLFRQERYQRRTLFGAHLDDIGIILNQKDSRLYGSRGQQKLLLILLKIAHLRYMQQHGYSALLLIDDFMADFDLVVAKTLISLIEKLPVQVFITSPLNEGPFEHFLLSYDVDHITFP